MINPPALGKGICNLQSLSSGVFTGGPAVSLVLGDTGILLSPPEHNIPSATSPKCELPSSRVPRGSFFSWNQVPGHLSSRLTTLELRSIEVQEGLLSEFTVY